MDQIRAWLCLFFSALPFSLLCGDVLPPSAPFSVQYSYYRAQAVTQEAEKYFQELRIQWAILRYKEAHTLLLQSQVDDKLLAFRISLGLSLSEAFHDKEIIIRHRLEDLFDRFTSNDKIKFEELGEVNECEPILEAK